MINIGTIEEKILQRQEHKKALSSCVVDQVSMNFIDTVLDEVQPAVGEVVQTHSYGGPIVNFFSLERY